MEFTKIWYPDTINERQVWYKDKEMTIPHREGDLPASEWKDGTRKWLIDGALHRETGPAIIWKSGEQEYYLNDERLTKEQWERKLPKPPAVELDKEQLSKKLAEEARKVLEKYVSDLSLPNSKPKSKEFTVVYHKGTSSEMTVWYSDEARTVPHRDGDLPAKVYMSGRQEWCQNGKCHRDNGKPAVINEQSKSWIINGSYHREDGPALQYNSGKYEFYLKGAPVSFERYAKELKNAPIPATSVEKHGDFIIKGGEDYTGPSVIRRNGQREWRNKDVLHRSYGPAIYRLDSTREYWENGMIRPPSLEEEPVLKEEPFGEGIRRQYGGPVKRWEYLDADGKLHRTDGPAIEWDNGTQVWLQHGVIHREDGPAKVAKDFEQWYSMGLIHRTDGPAVTRDDYQYHVVNGVVHNFKGPAITCKGKPVDYVLNGQTVTKEQFDNIVLAAKQQMAVLQKRIVEMLIKSTSVEQAVGIIHISQMNPKDLLDKVIEKGVEINPLQKERLILAFAVATEQKEVEIATYWGDRLGGVKLEIAEPRPSTKSVIATRVLAHQTGKLLAEKMMPNSGSTVQSLFKMITGTALKHSGQKHLSDLGAEIKLQSITELGTDFLDQIVAAVKKDLPKSLPKTPIIEEVSVAEVPVIEEEKIPEVANRLRIAD